MFLFLTKTKQNIQISQDQIELLRRCMIKNIFMLRNVNFRILWATVYAWTSHPTDTICKQQRCYNYSLHIYRVSTVRVEPNITYISVRVVNYTHSRMQTDLYTRVHSLLWCVRFFLAEGHRRQILARSQIPRLDVMANGCRLSPRSLLGIIKRWVHHAPKLHGCTTAPEANKNV